MSDVDFVRDTEYMQNVRTCVQHLCSIVESPIQPNHEVIARACFYIGRTYWLIPDLSIAQLFFEQARVSSEQALGPDHSWTLWIYNNLGLICREQGIYEQACIYFEKALEGMRRTFGTSASDTLMAESNLENTKRIRCQRRQIKDDDAAEPSIVVLDNSTPLPESFAQLLSALDNHIKATVIRASPLVIDKQTSTLKPFRCAQCEDVLTFDSAYISQSVLIRPNSWGAVEKASIHLQAASMLTLCKFTEAFDLYERTIRADRKEYGWMMRVFFRGERDDSERIFSSSAITVLMNYNLLYHVLDPVRGKWWHSSRPLQYLDSFPDWDVSNMLETIKRLGGPYHEIGKLTELLGHCRLRESYVRDDARLQGHSFPHCDPSCKYPRSIEARSSQV